MLIASESTLLPPGLLTVLRQARRVSLFTGADLSAEYGLRSDLDGGDGPWGSYDPQAMITQAAFIDDPALVWGWHEWRRIRALRVQPNAGHYAIASMASYVDSLTVVTQNTDDLHERAGSSRVLHLRGSLMSPRCFICTHPYAFSSGIPDDGPQGRLAPPRCSRCGGFVRPGVVWPGEDLPELVWSAGYRAAKASDVLFLIGASGAAFPVGAVPREARRAGALVVQVNTQPTELDSVAHFNLLGPAPAVLQDIVKRTWADTDDRQFYRCN